MTRGRSGRRRRRRAPASGAITATAMRFAKPASRTPGTSPPGPSPETGSRSSAAPSATVSAMKTGHSHAPRMRHRIRVSQRDSSCRSTVSGYPCSAARRRSRRAPRSTGSRPEDPGRDRGKGTRHMATEAAQSGTSQEAPPDVSEHLTTHDRVGLLRAMLMMRGIEERAMTLYRQGKVPGSFYDGFGQEAVSAGATWAMAADDRLCILHRDLAAHIIRGVEPWRIFAQYMGRADGITRGRDGNVHFGDRTRGCVGMVSMLPDMMLIATGMAMAFKLRGERRAALTWFGDGSTSRGDFHEAMNWAGLQRVPVIFVVENNQYAYSTPLDQQFAVDPVERAAAYGFPGVTVDGNDPEAMFEAVRQARQRAVDGDGPTLLEAVTMRMHGHAAHDDMKYVPTEKVQEWREKDPIDRQSRRLDALGVDTQAIRDEVKATIEQAIEEALKSPMPDGATATDRIFADEPALLEDGNAPWSGWKA